MNEINEINEMKKAGKLPQNGTVKRFEHSIISKCISIAICTRNYNWNNEEYDKGMVEEYRKIKKLYEEIEREARIPDNDDIRSAIGMLYSVYKTKKVPVKEQYERFDQIFEIAKSRMPFPGFEIENYIAQDDNVIPS
jgi:[acyl-carrier-protein] S-malonyltransferase